MDYQIVSTTLGLVIGVAALYYARQQVVLMKRQMSLSVDTKVSRFLSLKLYGSIIMLVALVLLAWIPHFMSKGWPDSYHPILHFDKTFKNTEVLLDGYAYDHCTFENVTFVYNGTTPPRVMYPDVKGPVRYKTNNSAIGGMVAVFRALGDLPNVNVEFSNPDSIVRAPGEPVK